MRLGGNFWLDDNIYEIVENGAKMSIISHSIGQILVGQLRESHAKWVTVGKPDKASETAAVTSEVSLSLFFTK